MRKYLCFNYDSLTISLWYGKERTANCKLFWSNWMSNTHQWNLTTKYQKKKLFFRNKNIDYNKNIQTAVYRKERNHQSFLHLNSEHPLSLKQSIPYSQAVRFKQIWSTVTEFQQQSKSLMNKFGERSYKEWILSTQQSSFKTQKFIKMETVCC